MKWERLRNNKCPKCGGGLYGANGMIVCSKTKDCTFRITEQRMSIIVAERNAKALEGLCPHGMNAVACANCAQ